MVNSPKQFNDLLVKISTASEEQRLSQNYIIVKSQEVSDAIDADVIKSLNVKYYETD